MVLDLVYEAIRREIGWERRKLISRVVELIDCNNPSLHIISLPTGYGKSSFVFSSAVSSLMGSCSFSTIYASPLRSLSDDIYYRFKSILKHVLDDGVIDRLVGLQYSGSPGSIYLNKPVVFTTFDTLLLHVLKLPPPEIGRIARALISGSYYAGHHEVSRGTLADSTVYIDEPHLALGDTVMLKTLVSAILFLRYINSNVVILSATMPNRLVEVFRRASLESLVNMKTRVIRYGYDYIDEEFESTVSQQRIRSSYKRKPLQNDTISELRGDGRTLIVVNTRRKAVELYSSLSSRLPVDVFILHGFMTKNDRIEIQDRVRKNLRKGRPTTLISTQVVEVGFDASFDVLITEEAPIPSLVQRAGRIARWGEEEGYINIHRAEVADPYRNEELERTRLALNAYVDGNRSLKVSWRSADPPEGYISYIDLVEKHTYMPEISDSDIITIYRKIRDPAKWIMWMISNLASQRLVRESRIIPLYVEGRIEEGEIPASHSTLKKLFNNKCIDGILIQGDEIPLTGYTSQYYDVLKSILRDDPLTSWIRMIDWGIEGFIIKNKCYEAEAYGNGAPSLQG